MKEFRTDINGLRAWAVVSVVLFHFGVPGFSGGFVGVDVFFVISGYLMTGIILEKVSNQTSENTFSVIGFYLARARRIIPALLTLCIFLLVVSWFYLPQPSYAQLATHSIAALTFISNVKFWRESGYFDTASHEKLLLHTWSLSVEWQFYIIFPLVIVLLWKMRPDRRFIGIMLLTGLLVSLLISVVATKLYASESFYLLPTRAWEMLAGGLVYYYKDLLKLREQFAIPLEWFGFTLITFSIYYFDNQTPWPGGSAIIPVLGCVFVLSSARKRSILTGTKIAQWLGKTSYSVYLWHWPIAVSLIFLQRNEDRYAIFVSLLLSLFFGWLSWRFIERPVRVRLIKFNTIPQMAIMSLVILMVAAPAYSIRLQDGVANRIDPKVEAIFMEENNRNPRINECHSKPNLLDDGCTYGGNDLGVIVIGDSHAQSIVRAVEKALPKENLHVLDWTESSCPTIGSIKSIKRGDSCGKLVKQAIQLTEKIPSQIPILIVNRISAYVEGPNEPDRIHEVKSPDRFITNRYEVRSEEFYHEIQKGLVETACAFSKTRDVYMLRPIPELKINVPRTMGWSKLFGMEKRISISEEEYQHRHNIAWQAQDMAVKLCNIKLLDPRPYLCSHGRCWGDINGVPLYFDDDHLSQRGADILVPLFKKIFKNNLLL